MQPQQFNEAARAASGQALREIGTAKLKNKQDRVFDIVQAHQRNGHPDMSGKEIQHSYELIHGERIDAGNVSARIASLVAARRLEHVIQTRPCRVTGRDINPVRVVAQQSRLVR